MIITCNNCSKNFNIDSSVIPEKGRLLQCNGCDHKWFFKKEIINEAITAINIKKPTRETISQKQKVEPLEVETTETIELLDSSTKDITKKNEDKNENVFSDINPSKSKKNYNILGLTAVSIISFVAIIIILDTFQTPVSKLFPSIEPLLYNLYSNIEYIFLFIKDLN